MRTVALVAPIAVAIALHGGVSEILQARLLVGTAVVGSAPIVGRARCGTTWLLTEALQLIEVSPTSQHVVSRDVRGLPSSARPWGLACVGAGSLWTLEAPRSLARLAPDGSVAERIALPLPRVALFASGDRLVFQQLPMVAHVPLLASGPPRKPLEARPWPGLAGRAGTSPEDQLAHNIVSCGISSGTSVPCWFIDEARISVSDGAVVRSQTYAALRSRAIDQTLPIWDAALVESGGMWVLATSARASNGRRAGGRLVRIDRFGVERGQLQLEPAARLILAASESGCTLLTVRGEIMEVVVK